MKQGAEDIQNLKDATLKQIQTKLGKARDRLMKVKSVGKGEALDPMDFDLLWVEVAARFDSKVDHRIGHAEIGLLVDDLYLGN